MPKIIKFAIMGIVVMVILAIVLLILNPGGKLYSITVKTNLPKCKLTIIDMNSSQTIYDDYTDSNGIANVYLPAGYYEFKAEKKVGNRLFKRSPIYQIPLSKTYDDEYDIYIRL